MRTVIDTSPGNIAVMDVFSKLIQNRIVFIDNDIDDELANGIIAQLLYLDFINNDNITIYINSSGGSVHSGLAIYDTINLLSSTVNTVCVGMAASMAAILLLSGKTRSATKHSRVMFHQPSAALVGKYDDLEIGYSQVAQLKKEMEIIVREKTLIKNPDDAFRLDKWYTSKEALEYSIITNILE